MIQFTDNRDINELLNSVLSEVKTFTEKQFDHIKTLNEIGIALSAENDLNRLLDMILHQAKKFTNSDGGTLYLKSDDEKNLYFKVVETNSLGIKMGGTGGDITWPPLKLYDEDGKQNSQMVATYCALTGEVINIEDVYHVKGFNFEGTKKFDAGTGYRSKSMLVIPMKNYENEIIGVLQLINRLNKNGDSVEYSKEDKDLTLSLASQAAVAITNTKLVKDLEEFLNAVISTIASAIDEKSPYTGGHIRRVAKIALMVAEAINRDTDGKFKDISYDEDELKEIKIAAWMHDMGKITTPEYVMDKATKLETVYDRIENIKTKFEILKRDIEVEFLNVKIRAMEQNKIDDIDGIEEAYKERITKLEDDFKFIEVCNVGGEFMADGKIARVKEIAKEKIVINGENINLLSDDEVENLSIRKGTLTDDERDIIQNHATLTLKMLNNLPFPKKLRKVPDIAGNHHEKLNGKGYPRGLDARDLSLESRILALADIFEALTAPDRPYKDAKKLSEVERIIGFMIKDSELDEDLVKFFYKNGLHLEYAKEELNPEQLDKLD